MSAWVLSDTHSVLLIIIGVALVVIVTALNMARRAEIRRLQNEVKRLTQNVRNLEAAEQRRFIMEFKPKDAGAESAVAAAPAKISPISEGSKPQSTAA
jgi:sulfite exporter TauE/SafE